MHDLVIRNASLIDGTGAERRVADVAITGETIAEVGHCIGPGKREINAEGLILTPGWVDIHTHYDGQLNRHEMPERVSWLPASVLMASRRAALGAISRANSG